MIVPEDSIPGQLDAIKTRLGHGEQRMLGMEDSIRAMAESLGENTAITRAVMGKMDEHYTMLGDLKQEKIAKAWLRKRYVGAGAIAAATTAIGGSVLAAWHWLGGKG